VSDLPASALTYRTIVAEYWLVLRGAGLMLSPLDEALVAAWEARGLPVPVVCRGLRRGLEDAIASRPPATPPPRALRAYRLAVEDEWRAYRGGRVGDAPACASEGEAAARRLAAAREAVTREGAAAAAPLRTAWRSAWQTLSAVPEPPTLSGVEAAIAAADEALLRAWLGALPRAARAALGPRCRLRAGDRPSWTRLAAYRAALRAHLVDAAREAGLLGLRGTV
jgi:hypothetical protein